MQNFTLDNNKNQQDRKEINIRKTLLMVVENWYYFVITVAGLSLFAYLYVKFTIPTYRVTSTMLIEQEDGNNMPSIEDNVLQGFGAKPGGVNLDNQILILTSWSMIHSTVEQLSFEIDCYKKGLRKTVSYYPLDPVRIIPNGNDRLPYDAEFSLELRKNKRMNRLHLTSVNKSPVEIDTVVSFGKPVKLSSGSFIILPNPKAEEQLEDGEKIYFRFSNVDKLTSRYRSRLEVELASEDATIIELSLEGTNRAQDIVFLDKLTEVFLAKNLAKKNHEANRIIQFIDDQLVDVSDSLINTENRLQEFRSRNRIMDVSAQATQIIDRAVTLENENAKLTLESNYYEYLEEYLSKEQNQEVPISPATMGIEDPLLANLMQELAGLQAEYFSSGVGERNPLQAQLELRIKNTKQSIRETLEGIQLANQMALEENREQIRNLNAQASRLPEKERQLLGIEREFNLNNVLYNFLLQKRAEAQIKKASNRPDNELIDSARVQGPVSPNPLQVHLLAISLGFILPFIVITVGDFLQNNITSEEDLRSISSLPIVGHIPHSRLSYNKVVLTEPQSRIAEAFRSLRTRMDFFTKEATSPIILITSSMSGEGKTFVSINLASAYSLAGKKTLVVGFDLRRPELTKIFDMKDRIGLSTYLIGKCKSDEIIYETEYPNLYILPSGPIPPNPGELANSQKASELLTMLREEFDFIIIDSAPMGLVSDNYKVAAMADATILLVRHGQTKRTHLSANLTDIKGSEIHGLSLLINDFRLKKSAYRYAYKYAYGDKYTKPL